MSTPNPTAAVEPPDSAVPAPGALADAASGLEQHRRRTYALRPGLHLHADDATDTQDYVARGEIGENLRMIVLLEGSVNLRYGERKLQLSSAASDGSHSVCVSHRPQAVLLSLAEAERFERHARRGAYARRLSLCVGAQWLEPVMAGQPLRGVEDFARSHLAMRHWQPTARFAASSIKALGDNRFEAAGQLTIKGKTQDVVIPATFTAQGKTGMFEGQFTLRRADFALGEGAWAAFDVVANEIQIRFRIAASTGE